MPDSLSTPRGFQPEDVGALVGPRLYQILVLQRKLAQLSHNLSDSLTSGDIYQLPLELEIGLEALQQGLSRLKEME